MKIMRLSDSGSPPVLVEEDIPRRNPGEGTACPDQCGGVTPTELVWYPTTHNKMDEKRTAPYQEHEFSGHHYGSRRGDRRFEIGQEVYGMNDWFADGAMASTASRKPSSVAHKPPH